MKKNIRLMLKILALAVVLLVCLTVGHASAEEMVLKHEFLREYGPPGENYVGEAISRAQGLNRDLRIIVATEQDVVKKYGNYLAIASAPEQVEYTIEDCPQIFVLHGFSGNGADDLRGMKISRAVLEQNGSTNTINVEIELPETTYLPFGSAIGTDDVRYINARIFFEGLTPGIYDINCSKKTVYIECSSDRRGSGNDKITKTEIENVRSFRLNLK